MTSKQKGRRWLEINGGLLTHDGDHQKVLLKVRPTKTGYDLTDRRSLTDLENAHVRIDSKLIAGATALKTYETRAGIASRLSSSRR